MAFIRSSLITFFFLLLLSLAAIVPSALADFAEVDSFVKKRSEQAREAALKAYNPDPESATENFEQEVDATLFANATIGTTIRRTLKGSRECKAVNPIDQCWRCRPNWAEERQRLADCARGFGYRTTGGKGGEFYVVTDPSDDDMVQPKPGTLRHAVVQEVPLWIIFEKSMVIRLHEELLITSNKTIDGRGVNVHIAHGAGITIQFHENVIIHNIRVYNIIPAPGGLIRDSVFHLGLRTVSDGDAITMFGATNVWIDHVSLSNSTDGLIDAIMSSTAITISNCKFNNHNDVMLLGAQDGNGADKVMQVTVAFNRFGKGLIQRMPRCRWGFFHVVNNDYNHWELYAIGGSSHPTIISQGNRFRASNNPYLKEVTKRDYAPESEWKNWQWRSEGDFFKNGAFFRESGPPLKESPLSKENTIKAQPGKFVGRLTRNAGQLKCKVGKPC